MQVAIFTTDGRQTKDWRRYTPVDVAASNLKGKGVIVFAIGIGPDVHLGELQAIASATEYIFLPRSFDDLSKIIRKVVREICFLGKGNVCY